MKKDEKETTIEQDIDARIRQLEGYQLSRAEAIQPTLSKIDKILSEAAPKIKIRSAKDFASIASAQSMLIKDQRLCAGMNTDKQEQSGSVTVNIVRFCDDDKD